MTHAPRANAESLPLLRESRSETETLQAASALAATCAPGMWVGLSGPLGAGKTAFVRGVVAALGGETLDVASPTYALVHTYETPRLAVIHVDLYRLERPDEIEELDLETLAQRGVALVEWPERGAPYLPPMDIHVRLTWLDEHARRIEARRGECG